MRGWRKTYCRRPAAVSTQHHCRRTNHRRRRHNPHFVFFRQRCRRQYAHNVYGLRSREYGPFDTHRCNADSVGRYFNRHSLVHTKSRSYAGYRRFRVLNLFFLFPTKRYLDEDFFLAHTVDVLEKHPRPTIIINMAEENAPVAAAAPAVGDQPQEKPATETAAADQPKAEGNGKAAAAAVEEPPKAEMRAVVLTGFGGLKSVKILKKPEPTMGDGEVVIRVKACGLNFQDLMARQGVIESLPKAPFILGFECSGVIEQVGEGVEKFKVGDRVVALPEWRAWSELVSVPAKNVFAIPDNLNYVDAAALATNYIVAYVLLFELGAVKPGSSLILHSAGGGVGQAVAQLCKTVDVTVFGVASKTKHEALKGTIDHLLERGSDYAAEVRKVSPEGVDLFLDCVCGEECSRGYSLLKPMGKYILFGSSNIVTGETKSFFSAAKSWWQVDKISPLKLFDDSKTLMGFNLRRLLFHQNQSEYVANIFDKVIGLWKDGKVKPVIDSTWAFEDVGEAMQKMHDRKNIGKIVLDPSLEPKPKPATPVKGKSKNADKEKDKKEEDSSANGTTTPEVSSPTTKEKEKEKESS